MARSIEDWINGIANLPIEVSEDAEATPADVARMMRVIQLTADRVMAGELKGLIVIGLSDDAVYDAYVLADTMNRFTAVGAIEGLKRDLMRTDMDSRVEYLSAAFLASDDEDDE